MTKTELAEQKRRLQTMVTADFHRRVKVAAAIDGITIEQWLERAAEEKLSRESRAALSVVKGET